jgi:hypothetical protein
MSNTRAILLSLFIGIAAVAFIAGVTAACILSFSPDAGKDSLPPFVSATITSIAALLATNLGSILGITVTNPQSHFRIARNWSPLAVFQAPSTTTLQTWGCYLYVGGLLAATVIWGFRGFDSKSASPVVPLIEDLAKSLAGIIVGSVAIALNSTQPPKP